MLGSNIACRKCNAESASVGCICYKEVYLLGSHCLITHIQHCGGLHYVIDLSYAEELASNPIHLMEYLGEQKILSRFPKVGLYEDSKYYIPFIFPEHNNQGNTTLASDLELSLGPSAMIAEQCQSRFLYETVYIYDEESENFEFHPYDIISKSFGEAEGPNLVYYEKVIHRNAYREVYYQEDGNFYRYDNKTKRSIIVLSLTKKWISGIYLSHGDILISKGYELFYKPGISFYTNRAHVLPTHDLLKERLDSKTYAFWIKSEIEDIVSAESRLYVIQAGRIGVCDSSMRLLYEISFEYPYYGSDCPIKYTIYRNKLYMEYMCKYKIDLSPEIHHHKVHSVDHFKKNFNSRYYCSHSREYPMIIDLKYMIGYAILLENGTIYCEIPDGKYLLESFRSLYLYTINTKSFKKIRNVFKPTDLDTVYDMLYHKEYVYALSREFIYRYNIAKNCWKKMIILPEYPNDYSPDIEDMNDYIPLIIDNRIYIIRRLYKYIDVYDIKSNEYHSNEFLLPGIALLVANVEGRIFIEYKGFYQIYNKDFLLLEEDDTLPRDTFRYTVYNFSANFYKGKLYYGNRHTDFIDYIDIKNKERGSEVLELQKVDLITHT